MTFLTCFALTWAALFCVVLLLSLCRAAKRGDGIAANRPMNRRCKPRPRTISTLPPIPIRYKAVQFSNN